MNINAQALLDLVLVVFGATALIELHRIPVRDTFLRVLRVVISVVVGILGVAIPGIYGVLFLCHTMNLFNAKLIDASSVGVFTSLATLAMTYLSYRLERTKAKQPGSAAA